MTLLRLALRSHRTSVVVMAVIGALGGALNAAAFVQLAGTTAAERAAFGREMELLGKQLAYLLPDPVQLDTLGGYLTWRAFGLLSLVFSIWAILASTGAGRGDEEKGITEQWLAAGVSRARWLLTRSVGFVTAAAAALGVTFAATAAAAAGSGESLALDATVLETIVTLGLVLSTFGVGLVVAQLVVTRRSSGAIGAVLVIALYELHAAARAGMDVGVLEEVNPFALYARSAPFLAGGGVDAAATVALYAIAAALVGLAALAFTRRDIGAALVRLGNGRTARASSRPSGDPLLRAPVLALVDQQRWGLAGWTVAFAAFAWFLASLARTIVDSMLAIPTLAVYFERLGVTAYTDFVGVLWFGTGPFVLSGLAVTQASGWAADDAEGRLEAQLASGASRPRVVLERVAALLVITAVVAAVSSLVVFVTTDALGITLPGDRMVLATVLELAVIFAFAGIGSALVGWAPRAAVLGLGTVAVVSYFLQQFSAIFAWPEWVGRLSIYQLYGTPLSKDDWIGPATLVAVGVAGTAVALLTMRRRDVGT